MHRLILLVGLFSLATHGAEVSRARPQTSDWALMLFMNTKNNLECAGLANFLEIANVRSTAKVNIIVELGRPIKHHYTSDEGGWSGVLRFHVSKGMHPVVSSAIN